MLDTLAATGQLYHWDTGGDGDARLGLWVDEPLSPEFLPYAQPLARIAAFQVPSGRLYFTGTEYVFREDDAFLKKHPHMGQSSDVPAGVYGFELYALTYPDDHEEQRIEARLTPTERRIQFAVEALLSFGGMGLIVALLVLPWLPRGFKWVGWVLLLGGLELLVSRATRLPAYRRMVQKRKQLEREQPDYALVLHRRR